MGTWDFQSKKNLIIFSASENLLSLTSLQISVKWACKSGLKDKRDGLWRRRLKKRKHLEDLRSGSVRTWKSVVGLRLERKVVVVVLSLSGLGLEGEEGFWVLEMICVISW